MKPNLFHHSCKIYRLKCTIPKFEMARTKIEDFTSAESWAILSRKMVKGLDRVCCKIPWLHDVILRTEVLFTLTEKCRVKSRNSVSS